MTQTATKNIVDVAQELGRYSVEAYEFLRESLEHTVERVHGETIKSVRSLIEWMEKNDASIHELPTLARKGKLPQRIMHMIREAGGVDVLSEKLNLHVAGEDLCWGFQDLAIERWGLMASAVLAHWGVKSTRDIGEMVFALVENKLLQKQPTDCIEDFDQIFDFDAAFGRDYKFSLSKPMHLDMAPERA